MTEPVPDRISWSQFLAQKIRQRDEIDVAFGSATLWEREAMKTDLKRLGFEIMIAEMHVEQERNTPEFDGSPW